MEIDNSSVRHSLSTAPPPERPKCKVHSCPGPAAIRWDKGKRSYQRWCSKHRFAYYNTGEGIYIAEDDDWDE